MKESEERKPWGFCETPEAKCTMNYCDENGCQNRKRTYAPLKSESEDISARAEEYVRKYIKGNVIDFSVEVEVVKSFIEGYKSCLAAQSQSVEGRMYTERDMIAFGVFLGSYQNLEIEEVLDIFNKESGISEKPMLAAVYVATWQEEGEVPYQLRSDECKPKDKAGDSDWWFDEESLIFRRYWSYHHELYGNQYVHEEVDAVPLNGC